MKILGLRAFIAMMLVIACEASLAATDDTGYMATSDRPNAGGAPEQITVILGLLDIDAINDKDQRFNVDAYLEVRWADPRLAFDGGDGPARRNYSLNEIWTPGLTIVNSRGLSPVLPEFAEADKDGNVVVRQRLAGELAVELDLRKFPFDTQVLTMEIVSYRHPPSELIYSMDSSMAARVESFSAGGWHFDALEPKHSVFRLADDRPGTSMLTFAVSAERDAVYYILTLALPMTLILALAWMVHWLPPDIIPARMGMSTATVFSLIALGVSYRLSLPKITYMTHADRFVIYSTILVLVSLAVTVLATRWQNSGHDEKANRLTRYARSAFPIIFGLIAYLSV